MRKSTMILVIALLLVLALAMTAFAQTQPPAKRAAKQQRPNAGMAAAQSQGWQGPAPEARGAFANLQRLLMPPSMREFQRFAMMLNLTEEQKTQVQALYRTFNSAIREIIPQRAEAVKATLQALGQPNPSKGNLQSAANKVEQLDSAILNAEFDFWIGLKGILNTQQQTEVQTYLQRRAQNELAPKPGQAASPPTPQQ